MSVSFAQPSIKLIEGAFIFRFSHFIDKKNLQSDSTINICIHEDTEILTELKSRAKLKKIGGNSVNIISTNLEEIDDCHILFLGKKVSLSSSNLVIKSMKKRKFLTISRNDLNTTITLINLKIKDQKLNFDANKTLLNKHKINLSSKVLRLADKVY